jgi:hypothetical protein
LTDSQRDALHQKGWNDFVTRYTQWIKGLNLASIDLRSLPRGETTGALVPPEPTLTAAVKQADRIVLGTVTTINPTAFQGTPTTIAVQAMIKGAPASTLMYSQEGGLRPTLDWKGITIADGPDEPLLLPGDSAVLLLRWSSSTSTYYVESGTGWYQVVDGAIRTDRYNPFASTVNGLSEAAFVQRLTAAVS